MIRRERDASKLNVVANLPEVRPFICYHDHAMDWSPAFPARQTGVVVLSNGDDAFGVFAATAEREWQVHTIFGPRCRGRDAVNVGRDMLTYMDRFADRVWGATPMTNRAARWFNRQVGMTVIGTDEYAAEGPVEVVEKRYNHA